MIAILRNILIPSRNTLNLSIRSSLNLRNSIVFNPLYRASSPTHYLIPTFLCSNLYLCEQRNSFFSEKLHIHPFHSSVVQLRQFNGVIPHLGDSITEATLLEWSVSVGQNIEIGDTIAIIETDKVTVDVTSQAKGVLIEKVGEIGDSFRIGDSLYVLETNERLIDRSMESKNVSIVKNFFRTNKELVQSRGSFLPSRTPSIKFLGKKGWLKRHNQIVPTFFPSNITNYHKSQSSEVIHSHESIIPNSDTILVDSIFGTRSDVNNSFHDDLDCFYGRLEISDREIQAIITGGASEFS